MQKAIRLMQWVCVGGVLLLAVFYALLRLDAYLPWVKYATALVLR